ncbi:Putative Zn-dependent protease [Gloeomargarita lithophora Alchichica-D10]|uniref:Zn-dependent protease n=1 Tax=Gloeomargarita lithophora Alchichica-D10 TaxID=1188229 RepID=A0A1J0AGH5_9CYAN|nr:TldD/PmbA family protein [Gloeomargarita lithophora]APB35049.1 Putative Zn-dependent protease [Gloeomargarita lithophora Alchichica-D10]
MADFIAAIADSWQSCMNVLAGLPEAWRAELVAESSDFVRFNGGKIRQTGTVQDAQVQLTLITQGRSGYRRFPLMGVVPLDTAQLQTAVAELRLEVPQLPPDPFLVLPNGSQQSRVEQAGMIPPITAVIAEIVPTVHSLDFTGLYAGGSQVRAYGDSAGQSHWFQTESFTLDYSLFNAQQRAVKGCYADRVWDLAAFSAQIQALSTQLQFLAQPAKALPPGRYPTYFAPAAVAELVGMLSWGGVSEAALRQGTSALLPLQRGERRLNESLHLWENFQDIPAPRFNDQGDLAPAQLPLIERGALVHTLISNRTAKEYGLTPNGAVQGEYLRAPAIRPGTLADDQVLATLDRGLYVSNLHYLNWSDQATGRITGMTRYACFWVERGQWVAPIENLRFDETLYHFWGEGLRGLTQTQILMPATDTYEHRSLGGVLTPGMLVQDFSYTL